MKELIEHIETLLLTNDCVIIPDFGGFIAFDTPAKWVEEESLFVPPIRTVGFNSQLKLNDGLIVQAYMSAYGTTFPDASKRVNKATRQLKRWLMAEGKVELQGLGTLRVSMDGSYHFVPFIDGLNSPTLYGLGALHFQPLAQREDRQEADVILNTRSLKELVLDQSKEPDENFVLRPKSSGKRLWRIAVASAAAVALFFLLSAPVKNIGIGNAYQAQIISSRMLPKQDLLETGAYHTSVKAIDSVSVKSPVNRLDIQSAEEKQVKADKPDLSSPVVPEESREVNTSLKAESQDRYYIIVSALVKEKDAQEAVEILRKGGYSSACLVSSSKMHKVCIASYKNEEEAVKKLRQFRAGKYEDAWVLKK